MAHIQLSKQGTFAAALSSSVLAMTTEMSNEDCFQSDSSNPKEMLVVDSKGPMATSSKARKMLADGNCLLSKSILDTGLERWPRSHELLGLQAEMMSKMDSAQNSSRTLVARCSNSTPLPRIALSPAGHGNSTLPLRPCTPLPNSRATSSTLSPASSRSSTPLPLVSPGCLQEGACERGRPLTRRRNFLSVPSAGRLKSAATTGGGCPESPVNCMPATSRRASRPASAARTRISC